MKTIDEVRTLTGVGMNDIQRGMTSLPTDDPLLAALYVVARSHPVAVKGNRDKRDRQWAMTRRLGYED